MATDNAVSALGKICEHQRDSIDGSQVSPVLTSFWNVLIDIVPYWSTETLCQKLFPSACTITGSVTSQDSQSRQSF